MLNFWRRLGNNAANQLTTPFETLNKIEVSKANTLDNFDLIQSQHPHKEIWPVLKANAYGHGIELMANIVSQRKPRYVVVDSYFEALQIWRVQPGQKVLLIGSTLPQNYQHMRLKKLAVTVFDQDSIRALGETGQKAKLHLKINTGMNRQGIQPEQIGGYIRLIDKYQNLELEGVCSHFADADGDTNNFNKKQISSFKQAVETIKQLYAKPIKFVHLAATAGSTANIANTNAIRLGIGLYGYNPISPKNSHFKLLKQLKPALSFTSTITNILELKKGDCVSYGCTFTASKKMRVGVLPVGYSDAVDRKLSSRGFVKYKGKFLPMLGRVCMNLIIVDLGSTGAKLWDEVEVISPNPQDKNSVDNISTLSGTIPYETLVRLSPTVRRIMS